MENNNTLTGARYNAKIVVLSGLFIALGILIPMVMPIKWIDGVFSATLASHVPVMLAMFINPFVAIAVSLGTALGFLIQLGPVVAIRAALHVLFAVVGAIMIKKERPMYLIIIVTLLLHTLSDMGIVYILFLTMGINLKGLSLSYTMTVIGIGTSIHHLVDFAITLPIYYAMRNAKLVK